MSTLELHNIRDLLGPGVYILSNHGRYVYVGRARSLLAAISAQHARIHRRDLPANFPLRPIHFDDIHIIRCDAARSLELTRALIAMYDPIHNRVHRSTPLVPTNQHPRRPARPNQQLSP